MKAALIILVPACGSCGVETDAALMEDTARLHDLGRLVAAVCDDAETFPTDGLGRADVYVLVRDQWISKEKMMALLHSRRFAKGPSREDIGRGSYEQLAYVRYKGVIKKGVTVPLLWDRERPRDGRWLAGFSDGSVRYYETEEFGRMLAAAGQER